MLFANYLSTLTELPPQREQIQTGVVVVVVACIFESGESQIRNNPIVRESSCRASGSFGADSCVIRGRLKVLAIFRVFPCS